MRTFMFALIFAAAFCACWIVFATFSQPPFHATAPVKVFAHATTSWPLYRYILAAFGAGLAIGLAMAAYWAVPLSTKLHAKSREMRNLQEKLATFDSAPPTPPAPGDDAQ